MTGLSYRALPKTQFRSLQKRVFPVYFRTQILLVIATAATHPPYSFLSLSRSWHEWTPLTIMLGTCFLNWKIYGPRTLAAMVEMIHQGKKARLIWIPGSAWLKFIYICECTLNLYLLEARDGYTRGDAPKSDAMKAIGRKFSREHAMSIHLNLLTVLGTIWYGYVLANRMVPI